MLYRSTRFGSPRVRSRWVRLLVGAAGTALLAACGSEPTTPPPVEIVPPPPNADLSGEFRLVSVGTASHTEVCVSSLDPSHGTVMFDAGALRFDTLAARVHMQHRLLHGFGCSGSLVGSTSDVDIRRPFSQRGDTVLIRRPHPSGGEYVEVASIRADTLLLSMRVPPLGGPGGPPTGTVVLRYVRYSGNRSFALQARQGSPRRLPLPRPPPGIARTMRSPPSLLMPRPARRLSFFLTSREGAPILPLEI